MGLLNHIYEDDRGATCFDRYFKYLASVRHRMPAVLSEFALDPARYALNGAKTLHDSWLMDFDARADLDDPGAVRRSLSVDLKLATHARLVTLMYRDVQKLNSVLVPDRWPHTPADLLVHEFTVTDDGLLRHAVEFDRGVWYDVLFRGFAFLEREATSSQPSAGARHHGDD
jgi:hypothetical protein